MTQENSTRALVCLEEPVDGDPKGAGRLVVVHGVVEDIIRDWPVEPTADTAVRRRPCIIDGAESLMWWMRPNLPHMGRQLADHLERLGDYNSSIIDTCDLTAMVA